jgi:hypothetical protein
MPALNRNMFLQLARAELQSKQGPKAAPSSRTRLQAAPSAALKGESAAGDPAAAVEELIAAVCNAHDMWRMQAAFHGIVINGPIASGGRLEGPALGPLIRQHILPNGTGAPYTKGVAGAIDQGWTQLQRSVHVPSLPWYPSFAAVPAPMAPPTPNVPMPLSSCNPDLTAFVPSKLVRSMTALQGKPVAGAESVFGAIATGLSTALSTWITSQMIMRVMGRGPVPSHAPPFVPAGPVVSGDNIAIPGHLSA